MTTGTGLDVQFGYKLESTVGTAVTVDKFIEITSESLEFDPGYIEPEGLRAGVKFKRGSRLVQSRKSVTGSVEMEYPTRNAGGLWKMALGSSVTTPTVVTAAQSWKQVHQTGDLLGKAATFQVGRPQPDGTVKAHTYSGCKCTGWEFSIGDNEIGKLSLDVDGWDEATATALASASYVASNVFSSLNVSAFTLGGTVSGTTELAVAGGSAPTGAVKSISIKGDNALSTERYGIGNAGLKKEQLENGIPTITGTFEAEYYQADFYSLFKANTATTLYLKIEGGVIGSSTDKETLEFIAPQIRTKKATPKVDGPDLVTASVEFEVYSDGTNNPFQVKIISGDSTAI